MRIERDFCEKPGWIRTISDIGGRITDISDSKNSDHGLQGSVFQQSCVRVYGSS